MTTATSKIHSQERLTEEQYLELKNLFDNCPDDCDECLRANYCESVFFCLCNLRHKLYIRPTKFKWLKRQLILLFHVEEADLCFLTYE